MGIRIVLRRSATVIVGTLISIDVAKAQPQAEPPLELNPQLTGQAAPTGRYMLGVGVNSNAGLGSITQIPGTGNPFLNSRHRRPSLLPRVDENIARASFEQPIPAAVSPASPNVAVSNSASAPLTEVRIPSSSTPMPAPIETPVPTQPPAQSEIPVEPQRLAGVDLLRQQSLDPHGVSNEHPLAPVIRWADDALRQIEGLRDYTGTFTKREVVDGQLLEQQTLYAKVRQEPFSVYLQFLAPNDLRGQEAIYIAGRNGGNLLAHPVGIKQAIVGTVSIAPDSAQAMEGNRHPITEFGLRNLLQKFRDGATADSRYGECDLKIIEKAKVGNRPCVCIQVMHPNPRQEFRFHLCRLYVDEAWNLPVRYECYDWPRRAGEQPQLLEEYTYQGLRLNAGLSEADFDTRNPQYRF